MPRRRSGATARPIRHAARRPALEAGEDEVGPIVHEGGAARVRRARQRANGKCVDRKRVPRAVLRRVHVH